jgi:hypothetical protein
MSLMTGDFCLLHLPLIEVRVLPSRVDGTDAGGTHSA